MDKSISVLVIAHEAVIREAVRVLCERAEDLSLADEASSVPEAIERRMLADVILVDVKAEDVETRAIERLSDAYPDANIVALVDRDELVRRSEAQGAIATLAKSAPVFRILKTIRLASEGKRVSAEDIYSGPDPARSLTVREREVLRLLSLGKTNREIAAALEISVRTVATHVGTIYRKLDLSDRVEAVYRGREMGLGTENDEAPTTVRDDPPGRT